MQYITLLNYRYLSDEQITNMQSSINKNDFDQMKNLRSMPLINLDNVAPKLRPIVEEIHTIFQLSVYINCNFEMPKKVSIEEHSRLPSKKPKNIKSIDNHNLLLN